jgi:hypothetical protein
MANTGNRIFSRLLKVIDDGTDRPLDVNNILCSVSGLPEVRKDNISGQSDYIAPTQNLTLCPLPAPPASNRQDIYMINYNSDNTFNVINAVLINSFDIFTDTGVFPIYGGLSGEGFVNNSDTLAIITVQTNNATDTPIRVTVGGTTQCKITSGQVNFTVNLSTTNIITIEMDAEGSACT